MITIPTPMRMRDVRTFSDAMTKEYIEQDTAKSKAGSTVLGDTSILSQIDDQIKASSAVMGAMPCGQASEPRRRISPEYKLLAVLILIVLAWTFVSWQHHVRNHH